MSDIISKYPYTDLHSVNLDYILKVVRENAGLHLEISGNQLLLKTADNTIISAITIPYATEAGSANSANSASYASTAGSAASATYAATAGSATTATNATNAAHATAADTATSATAAATATNADHATAADTATYATSAGSAATADYATSTGSVDHAQKAIETVIISGDKLKFTAYDGTSVEITIPYSVKAQKDDLGNIIKNTYIANVVDSNGTLLFQDATGATIVSLIPSVNQAQTDNYGNTIADYIKSITVSSNSNYVTVDHGTGTADTLTIHYSETAWKDTNGNVIKNTYIKDLEIVEDDDTGRYNLVAYNGDDPQAELFRIEVKAYKAQKALEADHAAAADYATNAGTAQTALTADKASNGDVITEYAKSFERSSTAGNQNLVIKDGEGNTVQTINLFNAANMYIKFKDQDPSTPLNPFDATFTVNHSEEYEIENLAYWGWDDFRLHFNNVGIQYRYADENGVVKMQSPGAYYTDAAYLFQLYDATADAIKVFKVEGGNAANTMILTRLK